MLPASVRDEKCLQTELGRVCGRYSHGLKAGRNAEVLLRPDDLVHDDDSPLQVEVVARAFRGAQYLYTLRLDSGQRVMCMVHSHHDHHLGEKIGIRLEMEHLVVFPADTPALASKGDCLSVVS